jgi:hypothetical protein
MKTLEEKFESMHLLPREERIKFIRELQILRPEFLVPYVPRWWWWKRCRVNVLIVCDGALNYGTAGFGLSEFLTAFNELEAQSWVDYRVTLAHRGAITNSPNPVVVNHISNFHFDTSVNLNDFDQLWMFAIDSFAGISQNEIDAIEAYMNGGGGVFATGDHGSLGNAMCGAIPRVKDMRYWLDNVEVSMGGYRRNDTNRPAAGAGTSRYFDNQSDDIPQNIAPWIFGGGMPHPLLSIKTSIRPSGVIDIMPDHPHEGECKPVTSFTVNGVTIPTQIVATSFVLGGSTTFNGAGKAETEPHCFPSISVWDGRPANAGRIVIDSTWHHFININLNGSGSGIDIGSMSGLTNADFTVIRQYFMNIATWMTRRKFIFCWRKYLIYDLLVNSQLIEASLNDPQQNLKDISLADLNSIGTLAEEILAGRFNPAFARHFLLEIMEDIKPNLADMLDIWKPEIKSEEEQKGDYYQGWLNLDLILWTAIGAGFIALRDDQGFTKDEISESELERVEKVFAEGVNYGYDAAVKNLNSSVDSFSSKMKRRNNKR